jgi:ankyrin repeat protein
LARHAEINAVDKNGWSALTEAVLNNHADVVKTLVAHGASLAVRDPDGRTLLMFAAAEGHAAVADILLDAEPPSRLPAFVNGRDRRGWTALHHTVAQGWSALAGVLLERGADPNARAVDGRTPLLLAADHDDLDSARVLLGRGARVNAATSSGITGLMLAAGRGHMDMVTLLLEQGADPNLRARNGRTAISEAARNGHEDIVNLLRNPPPRSGPGPR